MNENTGSYALITTSKDGGPEVVGLYPTEIDALYALYAEWSDRGGATPQEVVEEYLERGYVGDRSLSYHVAQVQDPPDIDDGELENFANLFNELSARPKKLARY